MPTAAVTSLGNRLKGYRRHISPEGLTIAVRLSNLSSASGEPLIISATLSDEIRSSVQIQFLVAYLERLGVTPSQPNIDLLRSRLLHQGAADASRSKSLPAVGIAPPTNLFEGAGENTTHGEPVRNLGAVNKKPQARWNRSRLECVFSNYIGGDNGTLAAVCFGNFFSANCFNNRRETISPGDDDDIAPILSFYDTSRISMSSRLPDLPTTIRKRSATAAISQIEISRALQMFVDRIPITKFSIYRDDDRERLTAIIQRKATSALIEVLCRFVRWRALDESIDDPGEPSATFTKAISQWIAIKNAIPLTIDHRSLFILPLMMDAITCAVIVAMEYHQPGRFATLDGRQHISGRIHALVLSVLAPIISNISDCPMSVVSASPRVIVAQDRHQGTKSTQELYIGEMFNSTNPL